MSALVLPVAVVVPLVGALVCLPRRGPAGPGVTGPVVLLAGLATAWVPLTVARGGQVVTAQVAAPLGMELTFVLDGLAATMIAALAVVGTGIGAFGIVEDRGDLAARHRWHWPLLLTMWAGLVALPAAADLLTAYVLLEVVGLCGAVLVTHRGDRDGILAGTRYLVAELLASLTMLTGIALVWAATGTVVFTELAEGVTGPLPGVGLALITVGLLLKVPLAPLHLWLGAAHSLAPRAVSPLLSAIMVKGAFTVLVRLWFLGMPDLLRPSAVDLLAGLGVLAVVWGSVTALTSPDLKRLIAASTLAQLGLLALAAPMIRAGAGEAWVALIVLAVSHAAAKAGLLAAAPALVDAGRRAHQRAGQRGRSEAGDTAATRDPDVASVPTLALLDGAAARRPVAMLAVGLAALNLLGLPPTGGFVGKWYLLLSAIDARAWWIVAAVTLATLLTGAYLLRLVVPAFRPPRDESVRDGPVTAEIDARDWIALGLAGVAVVIGLVPGPLIELAGLGAPGTGGG